MSAFDIALVRFLLASGACLAAGLGAWAVTALCRRRLPALATQRSTWLLAQLAVAATFVVVLLPHGDAARVAPVIEVDAGSAPITASTQAAAGSAAAPVMTPAVPADPRDWLVLAARAWCVVYLAGLVHALWRCRRARRMLDALAASGARLAALDGHAGFDGEEGACAPAVIEVDAPISPMLLGPFKPRLLLPRHLRAFEPLQQRMIVAHELTHWRRHDLGWTLAGLALQVPFWFNPFMRLLRAQLGWAQEFGCDRAVLHGRPPAARKAYAAALVAQLKLQQRPMDMALAFGGVSMQTLSARIALIRTPLAAARAPWTRAAALAALAAVFLANLALQPVLAWHDAVPAALREPALGALLAPALPPAAAGPLRCTAIVDAASGATLLRDGTCDTRVTPASTFKIAISLMGFDSGVLRDEHTPRLPYKKGYADWVAAWRAPADPAGWIEKSVVWYSQQVVTRLGGARVRAYVDGFGYGNRDLSGAAGDDAAALSELSPTLRISAIEQTAFLRKLVNRELPVSAHAYDMTTRLLKAGLLANGWDIYGKTGTSSVPLPDGRADHTQYYGWFVGWAVKGARTVVFARLVQEPARNGSFAGARARDALLRDLETRLPAL